ncbi:exostosin domain-containing protein [Coraliomargarita parva]|uniref:exostosin domain-containing protein n=1 Tax=Coraliomargarita parva TaxID=3014050 RepID=UPI0022B5A9B8|nr:exostosin family protein [Coraliomargarita parva]
MSDLQNSDKKVLLTSAYPIGRINFGPIWLKDTTGPLQGYQLTEDPEAADIILFVENHPALDPYFFSPAHHELNRKYPEKCVLYHDADLAVNCMRTIAPCVEKWQFNPKTKATFHYIARFCENTYLNQVTDFGTERKYLFSFDGSTRTNPIRGTIMTLEEPDALLIDRGQSKAWKMTPTELEPYQRAFVEGMLASHFILCPRGIGPASFRLFEAMQLARPPVIIADNWVPIDGIDWDACSIRIAEADIAKLPDILRSRVSDAEALGLRARQVWEAHFAPEVALQRLCEVADRLVQHPYGAKEGMMDMWQYLAPFHLRGILRYVFKQRRRLEAWKAEIAKHPYCKPDA